MDLVVYMMLLIQVDIGGHLPNPLGPPPLFLSALQFPKLWHNLLFLAVFQVLNFRSRFEALNNVFWEIYRQQFFCQIGFSVIVLGEIFPTGYHPCQTKIIRPIRDPRKLMYQLTQNGANNLAFYLLGLGFGM